MNAKIMAMLMVGVMMFSGLAVTMGNEDNTLDAVVGDGAAYSYTLTYHADQMANTAAQELQLTVADMTPISHASGTTTLSSVANEGSWAFNTTTGYGPFNSFYAAFDMTDGNKFVSVLDPYDLTKKIDGTALDDMTKYNIMWVLPTVYWSVDVDGNLTLTNDSSNGTAYAHTIDGHVYNYIAIGVYEGSTKSIDSVTCLTSQSGVNPTATLTITNARYYAHNYQMDSSLGANAYSMLWNFYQWELYKYCCFTVMEGFNSQNFVGNGHVYGSTSLYQTGSLNTGYGPYAGNPGLISNNSTGSSYGSSSVKLFIENNWGGVNEWVDGIKSSYGSTIWIESTSNPSGATSGDYVEQMSYSFPSGFANTINTNVHLWGMPTNTSGSASVGLTDKSYGSTNSNLFVNVGGSPSGTYTNSIEDGLSCVLALSNSTYQDISTGARLAFVMDDIPLAVPAEVTIQTDNTGYGAVSESSVSTTVNSIITVDGMTIDIGGTEVTASFTGSTDAQYTYSFLGWYYNDTLIASGTVILEDMTIVAKFDRTVNTYTITWSISGSTTSETLSYGEMPSHEDPVPPEGYLFKGWNPEIATVTGDQTYTAVFEEIVYITVTFDPNGGQLEGSATKTVGIGTPYGELPTPKKDNNKFLGWYTDPEEGTLVTADTIVPEDAGTTLYAHWELTGFAAMLKPLLFLFPLILLAFLAIALVRTFA